MTERLGSNAIGEQCDHAASDASTDGCGVGARRAETIAANKILRCLPGAVPHQRRARRRLRSLCQRRRRARRASIRWCCCEARWRRAGARGRVRRRSDWDGALLGRRAVFVTGIGAGTTYPDYKPAPFIVVSRARRRRHGHRRDRGHLQLLRRQGEDRHRPLSRTRAGDGARQGRGGRPRHDRRIRLADAVDRRRASPDRRHRRRKARHLRHDAGARQRRGGRARRSMAARSVVGAGRRARRSSTASRNGACASAAARRRSASSRSSGSAMSTR